MDFQHLLSWLVVVTGYMMVGEKLSLANEQYRNYVPHYEVRTISEARSLGKSIHDDIDVVSAGIQRIILWSGLQLDPDDYVELKLNIVQLSSMSALGSYYLMRPFIIDEITKVATNLSASNADREHPVSDVETVRLDKDEFRDLAQMFLMVSAWFRAPCNTSHLVEAIGLLYDLKQAFERDEYDGVRDALVALTELASSHLPHLQPAKEPFDVRQEAPDPEVHIADSAIVENEASARQDAASSIRVDTNRDTIIIPLNGDQDAKLQTHSRSHKNAKKAARRKSRGRKHKRHRNRNKHKSGRNRKHHNASGQDDTEKSRPLNNHRYSKSSWT